jgi:hypothetical protein
MIHLNLKKKMSKNRLDNNDALGSRIKSYEFKNRIIFEPKTYIVMRFDVSHCRTYVHSLPDLEKPFDKRIVEAINYVDSFIENNDFYGLLAYINRSDMTYVYSPIKWKMLPNIYNPQKYISTIILTDIPIYDIDIFVDNDNDAAERKKYKNKIRDTYKIDYLQKLFNKVNKLLPKSKHIDTNDIYNRGIYLANIVMKSLINDTNDNLLVTNEESKKLFGFDWELFAQKLGYKNIPKKWSIIKQVQSSKSFF